MLLLDLLYPNPLQHLVHLHLIHLDEGEYVGEVIKVLSVVQFEISVPFSFFVLVAFTYSI